MNQQKVTQSKLPKKKNKKSRRPAQVKGFIVQDSVSIKTKSRPKLRKDFIFRTGDFRLKRRELVAILTFAELFNPNLLRLRCNPGSKKTFPWLSGLALSFERYIFHSLKFHFITRSNKFQSGTLIMAPDYDAADQAFAGETDISQAAGAVETVPYKNLTLVLDPQRMNESYKSHVNMSDTRFSTTSQDAKTIDVAAVQLAGEANATQMGRVWVEYDVTLMTPQNRTEEATLDGMSAEYVNVSTSSVSPTPILGPIQVQQPNAPQGNLSAGFLPPLDSTLAGLGITKTFPTNILGTFVKDYEGLITHQWSNQSGSGSIGTLPGLKLNGGANLAANLVSNGLTGLSSLAEGTYKVLAKKGDILTMNSGPVLQALTQPALKQILSGVTNSFI